MKHIVIVGASGHAKVVASIATACGYEIQGFAVETNMGSTFCGRPVHHESAWSVEQTFAVAIGNPVVRKRVIEDLIKRGKSLPTLVHPSAHVDSDVEIDCGSVVMAGAILAPGVRVGRGAIINHGATIDHDCQIGNYVHVCPGVNLAGDVLVEVGTWIGIGCCVVQSVTIGEWSMVGAGSVVTESLGSEIIAMGSPARQTAKRRYFI